MLDQYSNFYRERSASREKRGIDRSDDKENSRGNNRMNSYMNKPINNIEAPNKNKGQHHK